MDKVEYRNALNTFRASIDHRLKLQRLTEDDLARRLNIPLEDYQRLILNPNLKVNEMVTISLALGHKLIFSLDPQGLR